MQDGMTTRELWHAAGRAARDGRKQAVALVGLAWTAPLLMLGSLLSRLVSGDTIGGFGAPVAYILEPLSRAYWQGDDLGLVVYLLLQTLLVSVLWGYFGGHVHRMAVVDLAFGEREDLPAARQFARRSWRTFAGARLALWLGFWAPLAAAVALAATGRLPGWIGGVLLVAAVAVMLVAAFVAVVIGCVAWMGGFLTGPVVAAEDSDVFDAVTRTFAYVGSGLPRLCMHRLRFFFGVLLGTGWRALRTLLVLGIGWGGLHLGAGPERLDRAAAIVKAMGTPPDAARMGLGVFDYALALALVAALAVLLGLWLADLITRVVCARCAVYLLMRRELDGVPLRTLRVAPQGQRHRNAEAAGFVEVDRIGVDRVTP